jgi:hypothetical protein
MGSMLNKTISASPMLMAQKPNASGVFFQALPGPSAYRSRTRLRESRSKPIAVAGA